MSLQLPHHIGTSASLVLQDYRIGSFIGANGSGKTRLGIWLEDTNQVTHRISAQKALDMPASVSPTSEDAAHKAFFLGNNNPTGDPRWVKRHGRWGGNPESHLLNDFDKLLVLLHTEEYSISIKYRQDSKENPNLEPPKTKLDILKEIWERVLPHRKLAINPGSIDTVNPDLNIRYPAPSMSDGERVIFYYIGEVLSVPENSLIIVDEPEIHVHKAVQATLWDEIENSRPDCSFAYLTHDIDFAVSRTDAYKIWVRNFNNGSWDYEVLNDQMPIPEHIYLEILGSRKDILFIEGEKSSLDFRLYKEIFKNKTVEPLGGCSKVLNATRSFNELQGMHRLRSTGLIDRDRKDAAEIQGLRGTGILIPEVAEVENFFLLEPVIRAVAEKMHQDPNTVFATVRGNVINYFQQQLNGQIISHAKSRLSDISSAAFIGNLQDAQSLETARVNLNAALDVQAIVQNITAEFNGYAAAGDYPSILRIFNNKGITAQCHVAQLCGIANRNYHSFVLEELKIGGPTGEAIRAAIAANII